MLVPMGPDIINLRQVPFDDFKALIKRIKQVKFLPDSIVIELIDNQLPAAFCILILSAIIFGENFFSKEIDLAVEYTSHGLIYFDEGNGTLVITIPKATKLILKGSKGASEIFIKT